MPVLLKGDSSMAIMPMEYSPGTVARRFTVLEEVILRDTLYQVVYDAKMPFVAVIEAAPSVREGGGARHAVIATLELQRRPQLEGVLVKKFWEDSDVAQVEGVVVDGAMRDVGLATLVYETVANKAGMTLLSDNEQYEGGVAAARQPRQQPHSQLQQTNHKPEEGCLPGPYQQRYRPESAPPDGWHSGVRAPALHHQILPQPRRWDEKLPSGRPYR